MRALLVGVALGLFVPAFAGTYRHQGRVLDANGAAVVGNQDVTVHLCPSASGSSVWSETHANTPLQSGYYAIEIGSVTPIPGQFLDGRPLWFSIDVAGVTGERAPLLEVPRATVAERMVVHAGAPVPCDPSAIGAFYFDSVEAEMRVCDGSEWTRIGNVNEPPTAPVVSVSPIRPMPGDTLTCNIDTPSTDPENANITYTYDWLLSGASTAFTGPTLSGQAAQGQLWTCVATPSDGQAQGPAGQADARIAQKFEYGYAAIGDQTLNVPAWGTAMTVRAWGAAGGGGQAENGSHRGGPGGYVEGRVPVTGGEALTVLVGRGGDYSDGFGYAAYPNGGQGSARTNYFTGGGGGRSAVQRGSTELFVAGGGGGAGATGGNVGSGGLTGGGGGWPSGANGLSNYNGNCVGTGGTQSAGGNTHPNCGVSNTPGGKNQGAHGGLFFTQGTHPYGAENAGGAGGDGYYGGGSSHIHGGGGGGSSYYVPSAVDVIASGPSATANPPQNTIADYPTGSDVGVGKVAAIGGHGRVVIWVH